MKNIAIITGGNSSEHEISLRSANVIFNSIDRNLYNPFFIDIQKDNWFYINLNSSNKEKHIVNKNDLSLMLNNNKIYFDCAFIMIHGNPGENGKIPAYLDMLNIPYTCSNMLTSAITFKKSYCKKLLEDINIKTPKGITIKKHQKYNINDIINIIKFPCIIKPDEGGSSFGTSIANNEQELISSINNGFNYDNHLLIEELIKGRELTNGILKFKSNIIKLPVTEIITKHSFFDSSAKYNFIENNEIITQEITPANIPEDIENKCKDLSEKIYNHLNCNGVCRIDYILKDNELFFLEINTIPGMSEQSIIPTQAKTIGISITELSSMLIEDAIYRKNNDF